MGGHAAGEVAARIAVESIEEFIRSSHESTDFAWPYGIDPSLSYEANLLKTAVSVANRRINRLAGKHEEYLGMGTTVVCALVSGGQLVVAHVGDSRLYLCSDHTLVQLTDDDSWEAAIVGRNVSSALRAARHVLTNVLGARPDTEVHVLERDLSGDETLLLCSDGLHGVVPPDTLRDVLASDQDLQAVAQSLIAAALNHGSRDNITALVVRSAGK
jgi:protein phosphatase